MKNVLEILDQKVGKGFLKLFESPEGMMYDAPEMYTDEYRILGVCEVSKNPLKPAFRCMYKEKIKLKQFSKKIKKESKTIYMIKESGCRYSRYYVRIALLILDREKTMVSIPSEPSLLRMYDDVFDIYLAPIVEEEDIGMSKEDLFDSKKAEIEANISHLLELTDCNNKLQEYMKKIYRNKKMLKRNLSEFLIMFKKIEEPISKDYINQKNELKSLIK